MLANRVVSAVISGPCSLAQWQDCYGALDCRLDAEDEALVDALVKPGHPSTPGYGDPAYPRQGPVALGPMHGVCVGVTSGVLELVHRLTRGMGLARALVSCAERVTLRHSGSSASLAGARAEGVAIVQAWACSGLSTRAASGALSLSALSVWPCSSTGTPWRVSCHIARVMNLCNTACKGGSVGVDATAKGPWHGPGKTGPQDRLCPGPLSTKTGGPSPPRRYTPSGTGQCRRMFSLAGHPRRWTNVTAPLSALTC